MRVLVTGANGFVGRHLCAHLRSLGDIVLEAHGAQASFDVTEPASVRETVERARPEAVVGGFRREEGVGRFGTHTSEPVHGGEQVTLR